jgi:hypothetical protein
MDAEGTNVLKLALVSPLQSLLEDAVAESHAAREAAEDQRLENESFTEEEMVAVLKIQSLTRARYAARRVELMKQGKLKLLHEEDAASAILDQVLYYLPSN